MIKQAFSLLELMTVISITSILLMMSVPIYKNYIIRSHVASALPLMEAYRDQAIQYYENYGVFPTADDLNLPTVTNSYTLANPTDRSPYTSLQIINTDTATCNGLRGEITFNFDKTTLGVTDDFYMTMLLRVDDGIVTTTCGKHWDTALSPAGSEHYMPVSCQDVNLDTC
jgi:prepilin-type N-terminal cleavage/methylation domain-containing protein